MNFLNGARVYLSGPMDFVASRADEKRAGWRNRVGDFLRAHGAVVFDPWFKPEVRGLHQYGYEDEHTIEMRERWTFEDTRAGVEARAFCAERFWETMHIDLRMVDTSDFTIAYCPTNIYSVGTPHEIILCRQQHKPVLFVSPPVVFPALEELREHLRDDAEALRLLEQVEHQTPIKPNPRGLPSLWYMPLIGINNFFDGFGFSQYAAQFGWDEIPMDAHEARFGVSRPLLPFLDKISRDLPRRWDNARKEWVQDDDWLLWELTPPAGHCGEEVRDVHTSGDHAEPSSSSSA